MTFRLGQGTVGRRKNDLARNDGAGAGEDKRPGFGICREGKQSERLARVEEQQRGGQQPPTVGELVCVRVCVHCCSNH